METTFHSTLGFCWWDIPALIILIAVVVFFIIRHRNLKRRQEELETAVEEKYGTMDIDFDKEKRY